MLKGLKTFFQIIFVLLVLAGIFFGIWYVLYAIWKAFSGLQKEVVAAVVAATATFLVSFISIVLGKYYEKKLLIEKEMRDKKIPVYNEFIEFLLNLMSNSRTMSEDEMKDFFKNFTQKILVWGSDEVINHWSKYRRLSIKEAESGINMETMFELENLLFAIRKDTGHKNSKIKKGDLLGLFINDIDDYL